MTKAIQNKKMSILSKYRLKAVLYGVEFCGSATRMLYKLQEGPVIYFKKHSKISNFLAHENV